ncbi:MAG: hypothetical protein LBF16_14300 [Pseudomonadales bacterium]|jgi:hypothetical protein|nr:hypothetical protein [Pseudomonadales bacterium]
MRRLTTFILCTCLALPTTLLAQDTQHALSGVWLVRSSTSNFPQSQWSSKALPFTPAGQAAFDNNKPGKGPREQMPAFGNDPLGQANPPGLYRTLVYGRPMELVQLPDRVIQLFEWGKHWRTIWTDGRAVPDALVAGPYWYGYSVGAWQGNTLVVKTVGLDSRAWLDEWGTPFTDLTEVEERWTRADDTTLTLQLTLSDPDLYAQPWTSEVKTFKVQAPTSLNGELMEQIFAPIDEIEFNERVRDRAASGAGATR